MNVFLNKPIPEPGLQLLRDPKINLTIAHTTKLSRSEWLSYCQMADVVLNVGKNNFDKDFFDQCPNVKAICLFSVGYDHVDINEASKRKVTVSNTPDVLTNATSDTAFLLMLMVSRLAGYNLEKVKSGIRNPVYDPVANLGQELYGKTLGIFGLGRIGIEMAKKCINAYGMNVLYHNRRRNPEAEQSLNASYVSMDILLAKSDVVSIHANYSEDSYRLFNNQLFRKMKPNAIFINTARGGFVDEADLYKALVSKTIWGAGLDVSDPEPMNTTSDLLSLPTVCVLPHIGSATIEARNKMAELAAQNVIDFAHGRNMRTCINREIYDAQ